MGHREHLDELIERLRTIDVHALERWGAELARVFERGGRLLIAGNGGSAAEAQHLSAELVGRFVAERRPLAAIALHTDTSALTAIANDYRYDEVFARQVAALGRPGDVLLVLSTSGRSRNLLRAIATAQGAGLRTLALCGVTPSPVGELVDDCVPIPSPSTSTVQECQLVAIHILCAAIDAALLGGDAETTTGEPIAPRPHRRVRVAIVGDVLLDHDVTGKVNRISPEAPVSVVSEMLDELAPGGAGRAAMMAAQDGHDVVLVTAMSDDADGRFVESALGAVGIEVINLGSASPTPRKTRIRSGGQTLLMLDGAEPATPAGALTDQGSAALRSAETILVADYGRGITAAPDVRAVLQELAGKLPMVWDPHHRGSVPVVGATLVTPNSREAQLAAGTQYDGLRADMTSGSYLLDAWGAQNVSVTRAADGALLFESGSAIPIAYPAPFPARGDVRGAGDRFAVTAAVALAVGHPIGVALRQAVAQATGYVAGNQPQVRPGTEDIGVRLARVRAAGGTVVATGGCFDLLHRGHVSLLQQARQLGDFLVVCLNSDVSVRRLKGSPRPLVTATERASVLEALACVDAIVVFDEDTPQRVLEEIRPDIYVKGGDYAAGELYKQVVAEAAGGQVVLVPYLDGRSTTALIDRVRVGGPTD